MGLRGRQRVYRSNYDAVDLMVHVRGADISRTIENCIARVCTSVMIHHVWRKADFFVCLGR